MAEFEEGVLLQQNSTHSCMEFINSQLMRKDDDDHHDDHVMGLLSYHHNQIIPTVNFTEQMGLFQSADDGLSGFGGSKKDKSSMPHFASPSASQTTNIHKANSGKKRKRNNNAVEKPKEVVHVRAKRGQATDSHSLAERVRREKINERLRCLQDLVPGCYKTMGMAVMLDVIINYVRSLQNQIEFLSMKLSAASMYNEMNNFEMAMDSMQSADHQPYCRERMDMKHGPNGESEIETDEKLGRIYNYSYN